MFDLKLSFLNETAFYSAHKQPKLQLLCSFLYTCNGNFDMTCCFSWNVAFSYRFLVVFVSLCLNLTQS